MSVWKLPYLLQCWLSHASTIVEKWFCTELISADPCLAKSTSPSIHLSASTKCTALTSLSSTCCGIVVSLCILHWHCFPIQPDRLNVIRRGYNIVKGTRKFNRLHEEYVCSGQNSTVRKLRLEARVCTALHITGQEKTIILFLFQPSSTRRLFKLCLGCSTEDEFWSDSR